MAKFLLKAGAEVDFLTEAELGKRLGEMTDHFTKMVREQEGETITRSAASFLTDSSGNTTSLPAGGGVVYDVPVGFEAYLTRLSVDFEGSNANTPTSCDLRVVADYNTPSALRAIFTSVPSVYEASRSHAALFRGGQRIVVCLQGGPHSTAIYCTVQVILTSRKALDVDTLTSE